MTDLPKDWREQLFRRLRPDAVRSAVAGSSPASPGYAAARKVIDEQDSRKHRLAATLTNAEWLRTNRQALLDMLPETWTLVENVNLLRIGFKLKCLGVDWRSDDEFASIMVWLEKSGHMLRDGRNVRRAL